MWAKKCQNIAFSDPWVRLLHVFRTVFGLGVWSSCGWRREAKQKQNTKKKWKMNFPSGGVHCCVCTRSADMALNTFCWSPIALLACFCRGLFWFWMSVQAPPDEVLFKCWNCRCPLFSPSGNSMAWSFLSHTLMMNYEMFDVDVLDVGIWPFTVCDDMRSDLYLFHPV